MSQLVCNNVQRREDIRQHQALNGLDYVEVVSEDQKTLQVHFLGKSHLNLAPANVRIVGGRRIRNITVKQVEVHHIDIPEFDDYMEIIVDKAGDFSTYSIQVVEKNNHEERQPHKAFDPRYASIDFSFKADCPNELDCKQTAVCPPEPLDEPEISYLAKDYASFRQLILDRLALTMSDWKERHVPDLGIALVEVLAYVGDYLSYYQDAVATEAYLDTARKRTSVRRHVRLVDYRMHEGCNARTWLCLEVLSNPLTIDLSDIYFVTGFNDALKASSNVMPSYELEKQYKRSQYEVFEPIMKETIELYQDHNRMHFYTWGDSECCLPMGSTRATLVYPGKPGKTDDEKEQDNCQDEVKHSAKTENKSESESETTLQPGDVLIFEEVIGPETGDPADANIKHRHAVLLTAVESDVDPLNGQHVLNITWHDDDALPFPLCLSVLGPAPDCSMIENVSIARGNVILVDHGLTLPEEDLGRVAVKNTDRTCLAEGLISDVLLHANTFHASLKHSPLTFSQPVKESIPASKVLSQNVRLALPNIELSAAHETNGQASWYSRYDLLESQGNDRHFVVEMDENRVGNLRFGNGELGKQPEANSQFTATYRIGNGQAGNIGAEALSHLVYRKIAINEGIIRIRNPLPALSGTDPESVDEVKLFAPQMFRKDLQRAIIARDYAEIVEREFRHTVQRAAAKLRWTGSGYEMLVAIDPYGKEQASEDLLKAVTTRLHRYRRMGHDLVVRSACRVPLIITMTVCVLTDYLRGHVKARLLELFSNKLLLDGTLGFFHPDNLSFGEGLHLSKIIALAQSVDGVESIEINTFQPLHEASGNELENGIIPLDDFEIARLDNDPGFPENGMLMFEMKGGRS